MTTEDQKARDEFEAWFREGNGEADKWLASAAQYRGQYNDSTTDAMWEAWQASRRTYRATVLEEAAEIAKRGIGTGALSKLEEYRAKFIEDEIRALAVKTREG